MKRLKRLSATFVNTVNVPGRYGDGRGGHGLSLLVKPASNGGLSKSWAQRIRLDGKAANVDLGAVSHGFRSSFRDWVAERTAVPREVCELALAHVNGDRVEATYRRNDLFEKRRELMVEWADYLSQCCGVIEAGAVN